MQVTCDLAREGSIWFDADGVAVSREVAEGLNRISESESDFVTITLDFAARKVVEMERGCVFDQIPEITRTRVFAALESSGKTVEASPSSYLFDWVTDCCADEMTEKVFAEAPATFTVG